jgi:hypothetical protein
LQEKVSTLCQLTLQRLRDEGVIYWEARSEGGEVRLLTDAFLRRELAAWRSGREGGGRWEDERLLRELRRDREGHFYHVSAERLLRCAAWHAKEGGGEGGREGGGFA